MPIFLKLLPLLPFTALCLFTAGMRITHETTLNAATTTDATTPQAAATRSRIFLIGPAMPLPGGGVAVDGTIVPLTIVAAHPSNPGTTILRLSNGISVRVLDNKVARFHANQQIDVHVWVSPDLHSHNTKTARGWVANVEGKSGD